ncbi:TonB-dependent receptor [Hymenobacter sp. NST-14]|uniref:SusC/RagA family TonB-linked outer membrane protein n=1 Tax=Hymenobacter piscis TaxID=2839984 RepID=UPI001C023B00|nr:TonB-dependent receptor [Hymenobacter piscis]MBT9395205.1 TonB-dependent receptor [Hymenobacter piscis]
MKKVILSVLPLVAFAATQATAQTKAVSGRVVDRATGDGIPGVTVIVKGTSIGVSTNADGSFALNAPTSATTLSLSSVGFISQEVAITDGPINVGLATDSKQLSEVVVVGYGEQSKALVTGAISQVDAKEFASQPVASVEQVLQGRASGVQVSSNSGTPGGGISVRIRGNNSISASSDPLYVVDGVPINSGSYSNVGVGNQQLNALADINPNDIASIEVLKDASAAAIYGSRGANGVVLVTTKRGQSGKTKITLDAYAGVQQTWNRLDVLNGQQSQDLINEARTNVGLAPRYVEASPNPSSQQLFTGASTNWQDEIFRDALIQNYTVSASGGDAKTRFLVSGTYFDQEGIVLGSSFNRGSGRFNLDHQVSNKFKVGLSLTGSRSLSNRINNDNNIYGVLSTALLLGSQFPVYNPDGTFGRDPFSSVENPVAAAILPTFLARNNRAIGSLYGDYQLAKGLRLRSSIGGDYLNLKEDVYIPSTALQAVGSSGRGNANSRYDVGWINENTLSYDKQIGDHSLTVLLGQSAQRSTEQGIITQVTGFATNKITQLSAGSVKTEAASDETLWTLLSFFGRVNYNYQGKYIFSGSLRRDGSSRFGTDNKYGYFPAASVAWRVSEEAFLKDNATLSELKLRAGYGVVGNFNIGNFASRNLFGVGATNLANYNAVAGFAPVQLGVSDLGWEQTTEYSAGIDLGFWENRVSLSANAFQREAKDLLLNRQLPLTSGFTSVTQNIGDLENKGLEFDLTTQNVRSASFSWSTNLNISIIRNEVTRLVDNAPFAAGFANRVQVGQPLGSFYGYVVDRIYQTAGEIESDNAEARRLTGNPNARYQGTTAATNPRPGDIRFRDLNGDGVVTALDQEIIGSAQPKFFGGMNNTLSFKGIDLNFFLQFTKGNQIYNNSRAFAEGMNGQFGQLASTLERWTPDNPSTSMPRAAWGDPNNNRRTSDRWLEDGSYMRLKTATLGYNLPTAWIAPLRMQSARIYLAGQNLLTFTKYKGLDPEVNTFSGSNISQGTDFLTFPQARVYQVGVNIGL